MFGNMISCLWTWFHVWEHDFMFQHVQSCPSCSKHASEFGHVQSCAACFKPALCIFRECMSKVLLWACTYCVLLIIWVFTLPCSKYVWHGQNITWTCSKHEQNTACSRKRPLLACFNHQKTVFFSSRLISAACLLCSHKMSCLTDSCRTPSPGRILEFSPSVYW